jgi:RNAse (barnase) inhibitor barstar
MGQNNDIEVVQHQANTSFPKRSLGTREMDRPMVLVKVDTSRITDWNTFHDVFAEAFGFPAFYGRNMNAWIDCMRYLDDPAAEMTKIHVSPGGVVVMQLDEVKDFASRCPELYATLIECCASVNYGRIEMGYEAILALSFHT